MIAKTTETPAVDFDIDFDAAELRLDELTVVAVFDTAALPEGSASYKSSSTCIVTA